MEFYSVPLQAEPNLKSGKWRASWKGRGRKRKFIQVCNWHRMHVKLGFPELGSARKNNEEILNAATESASESVCASAVLYRAVIGKTWDKLEKAIIKAEQSS